MRWMHKSSLYIYSHIFLSIFTCYASTRSQSHILRKRMKIHCIHWPAKLTSFFASRKTVRENVITRSVSSITCPSSKIIRWKGEKRLGEFQRKMNFITWMLYLRKIFHFSNFFQCQPLLPWWPLPYDFLLLFLQLCGNRIWKNRKKKKSKLKPQWVELW